ncbi:MAG TPA: response regulator transcription factor [Thermoleophilaceae bacterium]|nr:response regulator transcription factor [Thermoleophilaceae bacterium]
MIRVLVVDDHPAVLAGLLVALRSEPGIVPVAGVASAQEALSELERGDVDVALVDYHLPDDDGLALCQRLKARDRPPRVLVYSAFAGMGLAVPARVAGADGLVDKGVATDTLLDAIRSVWRGIDALPPVSADQLEAATAKLDDEDMPVLAMLAGGTPRKEIAEVLSMDDSELEARLGAMLKRLRRRSPNYHAGVH